MRILLRQSNIVLTIIIEFEKASVLQYLCMPVIEKDFHTQVKQLACLVRELVHMFLCLLLLRAPGPVDLVGCVDLWQHYLFHMANITSSVIIG